jgi:heme-degrading monooxygenase HmoA
MYTTIRRYHVTDKEELTRRTREDFLPKLKELPGFLGYYVVDGEGDTWVSLSVFETREGAEASNRLAADEVRELHLEHLFTGEPDIVMGDTVIAEWREEREERRAA